MSGHFSDFFFLAINFSVSREELSSVMSLSDREEPGKKRVESECDTGAGEIRNSCVVCLESNRVGVVLDCFCRIIIIICSYSNLF